MRFKTWNSVPILENQEPLVEIIENDRLVIKRSWGQYVQQRPDNLVVRETLAYKLEELSDILPPTLGVLVMDGWRSAKLQEVIFSDAQVAFAQQEVVENKEDLQFRVSQIISPVGSANNPSPHTTGGAVDISLFYTETNQPVDMGYDPGVYDERCESGYWEEHEINLEAREMRRSLATNMAFLGFVNYPSKAWHFEFGTQYHAFQTGGVARYGGVASWHNHHEIQKEQNFVMA